jgi:hypothetical protein
MSAIRTYGNTGRYKGKGACALAGGPKATPPKGTCPF